jgi:hypothetical protein
LTTEYQQILDKYNNTLAILAPEPNTIRIGCYIPPGDILDKVLSNFEAVKDMIYKFIIHIDSNTNFDNLRQMLEKMEKVFDLCCDITQHKLELTRKHTSLTNIMLSNSMSITYLRLGNIVAKLNKK